MIHNKHIFKFLSTTAFVFTLVTSTAQASFNFFAKLQELTTVKANDNKCNLGMLHTTPPRDV